MLPELGRGVVALVAIGVLTVVGVVTLSTTAAATLVELSLELQVVEALVLDEGGVDGCEACVVHVFDYCTHLEVAQIQLQAYTLIRG